jgi:hypothetical protein
MKRLSDLHQQPFLRWQHWALCVALSGVGIAFCIGAAREWRLESRLLDTGTLGTATVTEKHANRSLRGSVSYTVHYTARIASDQVGGRDVLPESAWREISVGDAVQIRYLLDDPSVNATLIGKSPFADIAALGGLGVGLISTALWVFVSRPRIRL